MREREQGVEWGDEERVDVPTEQFFNNCIGILYRFLPYPTIMHPKVEIIDGFRDEESIDT